VPPKPKHKGVGPHYVSPSTASITIAQNNGTPVVVNLSTLNPACSSSGGTLTCSANFPATVGTNQLFTVIAYDAQNGAGNVLSQNSVTADIVQNMANQVDLTLNGAIASMQLVLAQPTPPEGASATIPLTINAMDADSNIIVGPGSFDNGPIVLSNSDTSGATTLSATSIGDPSVAITVAYNGNPIPGGIATFSASAGGGSIQTSGAQDALLVPQPKIYVANFGNSTVTTYNPDGTRTTPTISAGLSNPFGVAIDAAGKIYVTNQFIHTVTTYNPDGTQTTPTISSGLNRPFGVAVDAAGKIYVANEGNNTVTTYNPDGTQTTPTISIGLNNPLGVAVDAAGKIYIANAGGTVTTYNPDGTQTTPTISGGLSGPNGVTVDAAGKIYVTNAGSYTVTTYNPDGTQTTPTISSGINGPEGEAVDAAGKIYVENANTQTVTTYNPDGTQTTPTISSGLNAPRGVAVH